MAAPSRRRPAAIGRGLALAAVYSIGLGLPFVLIAAAVGARRRRERLAAPSPPALQNVGGLLLVVVAAAHADRGLGGRHRLGPGATRQGFQVAIAEHPDLSTDRTRPPTTGPDARELGRAPGHPTHTQGDAARPSGRAAGPRLVGTLRWRWRQLTSMRTALFLLLLLLAIAAVPGSICPQRGIDAARVADLPRAAPAAVGPWLDRLGFFDVYASPWFSAIYLLLFISLVGCIVPRSRIHWHACAPSHPARRGTARAAARARRAGRRGRRLDETVAARPGGAAGQAVPPPQRARRRRPHPSAASAATCARPATSSSTRAHGLIIGIAVGHLFGWRGDRHPRRGRHVRRRDPAYDTISTPDPGSTPRRCRRSSGRHRQARRRVRREARARSSARRGDFTAHTTTSEAPGAPERSRRLGQPPADRRRRRRLPARQRLHPGHHGARREGRRALPRGDAVPAAGPNYRSVGVIKVPSARPSSSASPASSCRRPSRPSPTAPCRSSPTRTTPRSRCRCGRATSSRVVRPSRSTRSTPSR